MPTATFRDQPDYDITGALAAVRQATLGRLIVALAAAFAVWMFGGPIVENGVIGSAAARRFWSVCAPSLDSGTR